METALFRRSTPRPLSLRPIARRRARARPNKQGVSGAGRAAKESNLYTEIAEGIHAYGVSSHRHMPEIEQVGR